LGLGEGCFIAPETAIFGEPGHDVWLGANAGGTDGVTIGDHAVIAMGTVVTKDVPDWAIMAGLPVVVVGDRRNE
jgi:acetyltransferase-like isoleucine patch superfamily enzyme